MDAVTYGLLFLLLVLVLTGIFVCWRKRQKVKEKEEGGSEYVKPELEAETVPKKKDKKDSMEITELEGVCAPGLEVEGDAHHIDRTPVEVEGNSHHCERTPVEISALGSTGN
ncbi:MAG: hypothetical protein M1836_004651 [Candelina mexicana]|nr:MAG: hypothetical protein M1836_004651 [Candelina mexicana]